MNKYLLYSFMVMGSILGVNISQTDIAVEIDGGNAYKFYNGASLHAALRIPISVEEEAGNFQVKVDALSGHFESGDDKIAFRAARNPMYDAVNNCFPLHFDKGNSIKELPLLISFTEEKILAPGTYVAEVPVTILKDKETVLETTITAHFYVEEQLEARIFLEGEEHLENDILVAFGEIEGKSEKELHLSVRANTDVKISISSQNNGRLILDGEEDKYTPYYIPYILQNKGEEISLLTKTTLLTEVFTPNMREIVTSIKLLVHPDMKKNFSGKYRDRICITISSNS
ncbi:MAG: hypothetical protein SP4CHLAM5_08280 [Chlamydiia bacterium]|nr:hypothetical protein [Chlamydiia bacterium]MCH9618691.1 hypothetical protein [Chlamydiia bacterium]MCH9624406.1 hypothetical protein [Chlamydiia bacterium]